jgi:Methylase involved in ubiquinone/menaquinone biosynthesis
VELGYIRILEVNSGMAWRSKRKVMHAYDVTADIYDERYSDEQHLKYWKTLESVDVVGALVLDVGCGSGMFFHEVCGRAEAVVGVDVSRKLLLKAKANAAANVYVVQADADHLPFCDATFNASFSFTVLQNMPKPARTLREIRRVTRRGGEIAVTGLKKAFPETSFHDLIEGSGMEAAAFFDEETINCYIAVLST